MQTVKNKVTDLATARQKLARTRDEIALKVHLAGADARQEWEEMEQKWHRLEGRMRAVEAHTEATAKAAWKDVRQLARDLEEGYARIRGSL